MILNLEPLNCEEYIDKTTKNNVGVISIPTRFFYTPIKDMVDIFDVTNTKCRKFIINNNDNFFKFIQTCYSLSCEPEPDSWTNKNGKKKSFLNWMKDNNVREKTNNPVIQTNERHNFFKFDINKFDNEVIITVFDTKKDKRLLIDGLHRAAALTMVCEENISIPTIVIYECYGEQVDVIFPCDIHQL